MDLVRKILLEMEEALPTYSPINVEIEAYTTQEIDYHLSLLKDAGLVAESSHIHPGQTLPMRLTWQGHEFLDAARDDTNWQKAKNIVKEKGGSLTFDVIKALLIQIARQAVGLP